MNCGLDGHPSSLTPKQTDETQKKTEQRNGLIEERWMTDENMQQRTTYRFRVAGTSPMFQIHGTVTQSDYKTEAVYLVCADTHICSVNIFILKNTYVQTVRSIFIEYLLSCVDRSCRA